MTKPVWIVLGCIACAAAFASCIHYERQLAVRGESRRTNEVDAGAASRKGEGRLARVPAFGLDRPDMLEIGTSDLPATLTLSGELLPGRDVKVGVAVVPPVPMERVGIRILPDEDLPVSGLLSHAERQVASGMPIEHSVEVRVPDDGIQRTLLVEVNGMTDAHKRVRLSRRLITSPQGAPRRTTRCRTSLLCERAWTSDLIADREPEPGALVSFRLVGLEGRVGDVFELALEFPQGSVLRAGKLSSPPVRVLAAGQNVELSATVVLPEGEISVFAKGTVWVTPPGGPREHTSIEWRDRPPEY